MIVVSAAECCVRSSEDAAVTSDALHLCCAWGSIVELTVSAAGWSVNCSASCSSSSSSWSSSSGTLQQPWDGRCAQPQAPVFGAGRGEKTATKQRCNNNRNMSPAHLQKLEMRCTPSFFGAYSHTLFLMEMDEWRYRSHSCVSGRSGRLLFPQLGINRCVWQHTREQRNNPALTPPTQPNPMWPECLITATNSRWLSWVLISVSCDWAEIQPQENEPVQMCVVLCWGRHPTCKRRSGCCLFVGWFVDRGCYPAGSFTQKVVKTDVRRYAALSEVLKPRRTKPN